MNASTISARLDLLLATFMDTKRVENVQSQLAIERAARLLSASTLLSASEGTALNVIGSYKANYRGPVFEREKLGAYSVQNANVQTLLKHGFVKVSPLGLVTLTATGKALRKWVI